MEQRERKSLGKKNKNKSFLPLRLNVLFFIIFLMFSSLILQLGVVQILYGEDAQKEINRTEQVTTKIPVPRGRIYDSFGRIMVDNEPLNSITYTPPKRSTSQEERLELAKKVAIYIDKPTENVALWEKKSYWFITNREKAFEKLTVEERAELDDGEEYNLIVQRITDDELASITEQELEYIAIKRELDNAFSLTPQVIKNQGVTTEEYAKVAEHLNELPGINVTTDWDRKYVYGNTFANFIGSVTSAKEGIPLDNMDYYMAREYSRNDRVGRSGLEQQYESVLKGQKEQIEHITDKSGNLIDTTVLHEGIRGNDLVLTIDIELQQKVDEIVKEELEAAINKYPEKNKYMRDAMAVMMDPATGNILAMSGQSYIRPPNMCEKTMSEREEPYFSDQSYRVIYDSHIPGSAVKGATLLSGYTSGVLQLDEEIVDRPIKIKGTNEKSSYRNLGKINDLDALRLSSNVYMFFIAMRMGGEFNYQYDEKISFNPKAFIEMRNYFNQFGLGVKTGIDLPFEEDGQVGSDLIAGKLMDFGIGQFDTYTTLQLAQYASTIANDGYRIKPQLVQEIRSSTPSVEELGQVVKSFEPKILNKVEMDERYINQVQEGFRQVFQEEGGTGYWDFYDAHYSPAGKTGTAQNRIWGIPIYKDGSCEIERYEYVDTENLTLVGYAPNENPEVAFAIVVPNTGIISAPNFQYQINKKIGRRILDTYFELKEERQSDFQVEEVPAIKTG